MAVDAVLLHLDTEIYDKTLEREERLKEEIMPAVESMIEDLGDFGEGE
jgi:hypothetical protein